MSPQLGNIPAWTSENCTQSRQQIWKNSRPKSLQLFDKSFDVRVDVFGDDHRSSAVPVDPAKGAALAGSEAPALGSGGAAVPRSGNGGHPLPLSQDIKIKTPAGSLTVKRWSLLSRIQRLCRPVEEGKRGPAVVGCGMPGHEVTSVNIHLRKSAQTGETRAGVTGVYRCDSPWLCPVCSVGKAHERAKRVQVVADATFACGGVAALVVLTASHSRDMTLSEIKNIVQGASSRTRKGRAWVKACDKFGILGVIVGQEVTYSVANGWHYHQHLSVLVDGPIGQENATQIRERATAAGEWIAQTYTEQVRAKGGTVSDRYGWHVRIAHSAEDASHYTAKGSMAWEISGGHKDETKAGGSITPWDIALSASNGCAKMLSLWREYVGTMPGTRSCVISASLAQKLDIDTSSLADDKTGEQVLDDTDEIVGYVEAPTWKKWMRHALAATFLSRVEFNGQKGFHAAVEQTERDAEPLEAEYQRLKAIRAMEWRLEHERKALAVQQAQAAAHAERDTIFARAWALNRLRRYSDAHDTRNRIAMVIDEASAVFPNSHRLTPTELYKAA